MKQKNIPSNPNIVYKKQWQGLGDWLGTGKRGNVDRKFKNFDEARKYVHTLNLKSQKEWIDFCKSGKRPSVIPAAPYQKYKDQWKGWADFLGKEK